MSTPEPTVEWAPGPTGIYREFEVPAAGHLGVVEEICPALHTDPSLTEDGIPFPCPACGGAV